MPTAVGTYIFAGGFTVGVKRAGFDVLAHLEGDGYGASSARLNWPELPIHVGPENWPVNELRGRVDFLYANPPCAIFSPMGISTTRGPQGWRSDPRLECWNHTFGLLQSIQPRAWALESVPQAMTTGREVVDTFTKQALIQGYSATFVLLNAQWMGIPQARRRFFLLFHKPAVLAGYQLNFAPPPTVGEALGDVTETGHVSVLKRADLVAALAETQPGERLQEAWMRLTPDWQERQKTHPRGFVTGRPSFADRRLNATEVMGAYVGDKFFHPSENRALGINEAKALCGYPEDFQLAGPSGGWGSLLARAVMPPVGYWLARAVAFTLGAPDASWENRRVTLLDVREPGIEPVDLTPSYLDASGRVRLRVRADGSITAGSEVAPSLPLKTVSRPSRSALRSEPTPTVPSPRSIGVEAPVTSPFGSLSGEVAGATPTPAVYTQEGIDRADVIADQLNQHFNPGDPVNAVLKPLPGEGSGKFIQRMWLAGLRDPQRLVELVHANWAGRTTTVSDVYYNYRKLLDAGLVEASWPKKRKEVVPHSGQQRSSTHDKTSAPPSGGADPLENEGGDPERNPRQTCVDGLVVEESEKAHQERVTVPTSEIVPERALSTKIRRILLTGSTPIQVGSDRTLLKIMSNQECWRDAIAALGFEVERRPVRPGEDLSGYEAVVACLNKPNAIVSRHVYGALWSLLSHERALAALDDWQTHELLSGLQTCSRDFTRAFRLWGDGIDEPIKKQLFEMLYQLAHDPWPWPVVAPLFDGGDPKLLGLPAEIVPIDPSSLAKRYPIEVVPKVRRWIQASLLVKGAPDVTWPLFRFGNPGRGEGGIGKTTLRESEPRVTEAELAQIYAASWGVISPPHDHSGSGWWRIRYLMAADAGCVISASLTEAMILGDPYVRASDPLAVEILSDAELGQLAEDQHKRLWAKAWSRERVVEAMREALRKIGVNA